MELYFERIDGSIYGQNGMDLRGLLSNIFIDDVLELIDEEFRFADIEKSSIYPFDGWNLVIRAKTTWKLRNR